MFSHHLGWLDKLVSILESMLMFYLAGPVATALGKMLLQTTPDAALRSLEACLREVFGKFIDLSGHVLNEKCEQLMN